MIKSNFHTHTNFCDGKSSPEKMVQSAIEKHFDILGFSSHATYPYKSSWHLNPARYNEYVNEIELVQQTGIETNLGKVTPGGIETLLSEFAEPECDGYKFLGWTDATGNILSTVESYSLTPANDITIKAAFASASS